MTLEMGKPLAESKAEVTYAADFFHWFAGEATRIEGGYKPAEKGGFRVLTMQQPVGPCIFITPWNFPLAMGTRKIGPQIAAGCTDGDQAGQADAAVDARARADPRGGRAARRRAQRHHREVVRARSMEPLIKDPRTRKLSFTGSTEVGKTLIEQSAEQVLRVSMELGGNAPFLVFDDADVDDAVEGAMIAKMRNIGEACTARQPLPRRTSRSPTSSPRSSPRRWAR